MANSRSARKRIRASERKRVRNRTVRSAVRTKIGRVRHALISGQTVDIDEELRGAVKALDKAAEKGIIHRNNAARRKSRLMAMAARLTLMSGSVEERAAARAAAIGGAKGKTTRAAATAAKPRTSPVSASATKPAAAKASGTKASGAKATGAKATETKATGAKATETKKPRTKKTTPRP